MTDVTSLESYRRLDSEIIPTPFEGNAQEIYNQVAIEFNQQRRSIMTSGYSLLFKHRRIQPNQYRLVHRDNVPELVVFTEAALRREKSLNWNSTFSTLGIFDQSRPLIGAFAHYVITVPIGQYAKIIDNSEAKLLGPGKHVVHSTNFSFNPQSDLISQQANFIQHQDIMILRVPPGKIAKITVDNTPLILESREEPYVFKTQQVEAYQENLFSDANAKELHVASTYRLLPDLNEVAVVNINGRPKLFECEQKEGRAEPIIIDDPGARFDGFLSRNLENLEFPSAETKEKRVADQRSASDCIYDKFYTADRVEVGVKFFVCYRITDAAKALENLSLNDIKKHIEGVV